MSMAMAKDEMLAAYICFERRSTGRVFYVSEKRGDGGKDWGYMPTADDALRMSERMSSIYINEIQGARRDRRQVWKYEA